MSEIEQYAKQRSMPARVEAPGYMGGAGLDRPTPRTSTHDELAILHEEIEGAIKILSGLEQVISPFLKPQGPATAPPVNGPRGEEAETPISEISRTIRIATMKVRLLQAQINDLARRV